MENLKTALLAASLVMALAGCEGETNTLIGDLNGSDTNSAPSPEVSSDPVFVQNSSAAQVLIEANDPDDDDTHTYSMDIPPSIGTASLNSTTGVLSYIASGTASDYTDSALISVEDNEGNEGSVTVVFYVGNISPVVTSSGSIIIDAGATGQTLIAVSDANVTDTHTYSVIDGPDLAGASATVTAASSNTASVSYQSGVAGTDTVTIQVQDSGGATSTIDIDVIVAAVDAPNQSPVPTASPSPFSIDVSSAVAITISANDPDAGDTHTYTLVSQPAFGTATVGSSNGVVAYTAGSVAGSESFAVMVMDNSGAQAQVTITGTINAVDVGIVGNSANGQVLMDTLSCTASFCHGGDLSLNTNGILSGTDVEVISTAIEEVSAMSFLQNVDLSDQDLADMSAYIATFD